MKPGSAAAHTLTYVDFVEMARHYGKVGGLDRMATLVNAVRADTLRLMPSLRVSDAEIDEALARLGESLAG